MPLLQCYRSLPLPLPGDLKNQRGKDCFLHLFAHFLKGPEEASTPHTRLQRDTARDIVCAELRECRKR